MLTFDTVPCAGIFMMLHAMTQRSHAAIMPLRSLNPYVSTALAEWGRTPGLQPAVPRQTAPASQWKPRAAAGTSSFGMSGTNAHMLAAVAQPCQAVQAKHVWQRSRYCRYMRHVGHAACRPWICGILHYTCSAAAACLDGCWRQTPKSAVDYTLPPRSIETPRRRLLSQRSHMPQTSHHW